ncbi:MAG TPA: copper resistance protein CopC [Ilumatobacteraceae bacterium]|nr:copper resistance protein CopC [Ilumatobacteraceae bacterium]
MPSPDSSSIRIRPAVLVGALVVLVGVLLGAGTASAHAELLSSFPANQQLLDDPPSEIALQFTEAVDPIEPGIRLLDADGDEVEIGAVDQSAGSDRMRSSIPTTLGDGTYVVAWQGVSADSHRVRGSFTFSVGVPSAVTTGVVDGLFDGAADSSSDDILLGIGRFVSYAGVGLLVGGLVLALALTPSVIGSRRVGVLLVVSAEVALVGTLWMIAAQANLIGGSFLAWGPVAETQSGQWWIARLVAIVLFCVLIPLRSRFVVRGGVVVVGALALGVLGVVAAGGHAISGDSIVIGFVATLVHLAAMSIWLGGLAVVLVAPPRGEFWATAIRFSSWALASVVALAITGGVNAWRQLGTLSGLTESSYGRWLVIKLILVVLVVGVAAFSRRLVHSRGDDASVLVRRSVGVEIVGIVLVLGATAGLVNSPPPVEVPEVVSVSAVVGTRVAQVELEPAVTGGTELHVYITSPSGALDRADEISVRAELPEADIPPFDVEVFPAGANHVVGANLNLPVAGLWTFEVTARYGDFDEVAFVVQIPVSD